VINHGHADLVKSSAAASTILTMQHCYSCSGLAPCKHFQKTPRADGAWASAGNNRKRLPELGKAALGRCARQRSWHGCAPARPLPARGDSWIGFPYIGRYPGHGLGPTIQKPGFWSVTPSAAQSAKACLYTWIGHHQAGATAARVHFIVDSAAVPGIGA